MELRIQLARMMKLLLGLGCFGLLTSTIFTAMVFTGVWRFVRMRKAARPGWRIFISPPGYAA